MDARSAERAAGVALQAVVGLPAAAALATLTVAACFTPDAIAHGDHVRWIGFPLRACDGCALCGMSRALAALLHGDLAAAWQFNPGVFVTGPLLAAAGIVSIWGLVRVRRAPPRFFPNRGLHEAVD